MHRFLISPESIENQRATIVGDDAKHLIQVLRHKVGDQIIVFDGTGVQYELELISVDKNKAYGKVLRAYDPGTEPETRVVLFQGIPKTDKMDWIIQKTVELGVFQIIPMVTQYSVLQLNDKKVDSRLERWKRIAGEACKQSGRVVVPKIQRPVEWAVALRQWEDLINKDDTGSGMTVLCYENESKKCLKDLFKCYNIDCVNIIGIFIGPEGGFSREELQLAENYRITPVSLGKRILRTETAAIVALTAIMHEMGEMRV